MKPDMNRQIIRILWHLSLVMEICGDLTRLVNMDTIGQPMENPLEAIEDEAEEDSILDDANLDVYSGGSEEASEAYNQCFLTPVFRIKTRSSQFFVGMGKSSSNHLIRKV